MYGTISFKNCEFFDFTPVLFESSYNAYTKFDLKFKNCVVHANKAKNYLISGGGLKGETTTEREELARQEYPNLYVEGLQIDMPEDVDKYYVYKFSRGFIQWPQDSVPGIKRIKGLTFVQDDKKKLVAFNMAVIVYGRPSKKKTTAIAAGCVLLAGTTLRIIRKRRNNHEG